MLDTTAGRAILSPEDVAAFLVRPVEAESLPGLVGTVIGMSGNSLRAPAIQSDPAAQWVHEGAEIAASDAVFAEVSAPARKVAGLSIVSAELAADSSPSAVEQIGNGLKRDLIRQLNKALVGALPSPAPVGLGSLTGVTTVAAGTGWTSADVFVDAVAAAASEGATIDSWIVSASDYVSLRKIRVSSGSNQSLITPDAGGGITVEGRPVHVSSDLAPGVVWGIPKDRLILGLREDAEIVADSSAFFSSDRIGIRATLRAALVYPHEAALIKIVTTP
ncbi:phage major capsid protein [Rhodococcus sp. IEGM 1408]|uniref:phage major capsid protein n=1 Tax=Rhodococcus sp. IEGM 1408 TaxID=3082220 RepID=UPI002954E4C3|nr:phage major capsid protein [Rhodococcus sp. IEGM 1408]MDV8000756.1 phage major capsid protein [Rhodococcus sp. IEGM 1408]